MASGVISCPWHLQGIYHKSASNWWVKHVLKKRNRTIASIRKHQTRYLKKSHKFDIELPKTVNQALTLDAKNGNNLWTDAISKEMENVCMTFNFLPDEKSVAIVHQFV